MMLYLVPMYRSLQRHLEVIYDKVVKKSEKWQNLFLTVKYFRTSEFHRVCSNRKKEKHFVLKKNKNKNKNKKSVGCTPCMPIFE